MSDVAGAQSLLATHTDLLVVGGPTHVHGMTTVRSRQAAMMQAGQKHLTLDGFASAAGVREWLATAEMPSGAISYAAFDTRVAASIRLTGRAAPRIAKLLCRRGWTELASPESFLVSRGSHLLPGEAERARRWGEELADRMTAQRSDADVRG